ncbi:hypothetical protein GC176_02260 [bacterium]|nr:hypothetical protein [bacterium]
MSWDQTDIDVMETLCCKVRVLSEDQIVRAWGQKAIEENVAPLIHADMIRCEFWTVILPVIGETPSMTWKPEQPEPDAWKLSQRFRGRWDRQAVVVTAIMATERAGRLFGSRSGHPLREIERGHDLLLAEVYLLYRERLPELAAAWLGEDALPLAERGVKNPDAFLFDDSDRPRRVIESAGSYSQKQVETFHRYCKTARLPYELW